MPRWGGGGDDCERERRRGSSPLTFNVFDNIESPLTFNANVPVEVTFIPRPEEVIICLSDPFIL